MESETIKSEIATLKKQVENIKIQECQLEKEKIEIIKQIQNKYCEMVKNPDDALEYLEDFLEISDLNYSFNVKKYKYEYVKYNFPVNEVQPALQAHPESDTEIDADADYTEYTVIKISFERKIHSSKISIVEKTIVKLLVPYFKYMTNSWDENPYYEGAVEEFEMVFALI